MNLVAIIKRVFLEYKRPRYRDNRGWYASALTSNARDLYWKATGEPETNPTDIVGHCRMLAGKSIEEGLTKYVLENTHWFGIHSYGGEQISVGGSNPSVNGYLDGLLVERKGDTFGTPMVMEVKLKTGYGAEMFKQSYDPGENYLAQLGYYLRDLSEKGITNQGFFLFFLASDKSWGEMVQVDCHYENGVVYATKARHIDGTEKDINFSLELDPILERLRGLEEAIEKKELPPAEHFYKKPLTPELVAGLSDAHLRKAIKGEKIIGDWQIAYSSYKDKHIELEGSSREYTESELQILKDELKRRYPKSRLAS